MTPPMTFPTAVSRRQFLSLTGMLPLAIIAQTAGTTAGAAPASGSKPVSTGPRKLPIGIELYAVRGELARDLTGTLSAVAKMGYGAVEFYAPYLSWTLPYAKEVRSRMDDLGLRCYSTHNHMESFIPGEGMAKAIELNQIIGSRHLVLASPPKDASGLEGCKHLCAQLTAAVGQLQPHGLTAGYHNHQTEWKLLDGGQRSMDVIAAHTPKEFVLQFDVGTCLEAGADPVTWIRANPGRIRSIHLKDWAPGTVAEEKGYRVLFGEGIAPWSDIFAAAESAGGVEYYLMEQEGSRFSEFETAQRCLASWRQLRKEA